MNRGLSLGQASKVALARISNQDNIIVKGNVHNVRTYSAKSDISDGTIHMSDFIFSDTQKDSDGDSFDYNLLTNKIEGMEGDLEHIDLYPELEDSGISRDRLFTVVKSFFNGNQMMGTVKFNSDHPNFKDVWQGCVNGKFGMSLVWNKTKNIISGISGTLDPRNKRAKIIQAYTL